VDDEQAVWKSPNCPPDVMGAFEDYIKRYEEQPLSTLYFELEKRGYTPRPPEEIRDDEIEAAVLDLAERLFAIRVYIYWTEHLADRELYEALWAEMHEPAKLFPDDMDGLHHFDMCEEDTDSYLRFYADDDYRAFWLEQFPDEPLPPKELPPYPRDHKLPQGDRRQRERSNHPDGP
jgi:hypothetical protein